MATEYRIYKDGDKILAIKDGFSWLAFLFGWLWALSEGLFLIAVLMFVSVSFIYGIASLISGAVGSEMPMYIAIAAISLFVGMKSKAWREKSYLKKGFVYTASITAKSENNARAKYYQDSTEYNEQ